jgi:hypothetical protein
MRSASAPGPASQNPRDQAGHSQPQQQEATVPLQQAPLQASLAHRVCNGSEKFLVRVDARTAALIRDRMRFRPLQRPCDRLRHIFHKGRLQSRQAAAEDRIDWKPPVNRAKLLGDAQRMLAHRRRSRLPVPAAMDHDIEQEVEGRVGPGPPVCQ